MQYVAKVSLQWNKTFCYMAFFLTRLRSFYNDSFPCVSLQSLVSPWRRITHYPNRVCKGAGSLLPAQPVGSFGTVEAHGLEHGWTRAGNSSFLLRACWNMSVHVSVPGDSFCCSCWCSMRNALPQFFFIMAGCRHREQETWAMIYFLTTLWKLSFQNLCRLGCSRNRKKETVWRKRLLHPGTASEVYKDNSLGDYGLQNHMECVKSWWIQCV